MCNFDYLDLILYFNRGFAIGMKRIQQPWLNSEFIFRKSKISKEFDRMMILVNDYVSKTVNYNKQLTIETNGANKVDKVIDLLLDPKYNFSEQEIYEELILTTMAVSKVFCMGFFI